MRTTTRKQFVHTTLQLPVIKPDRIGSIDLMRGAVMIIMALDHVRDYFHRDAFVFDPTDLTQTTVILFFTRFITHYCAPVFVFLAGVSAYLHGSKKTRRASAIYLLSRGIWLVFVELFIVSLGRTFNLTYPFFNLQVIWAIGISMIVLSGLIFLHKKMILFVGLSLIVMHNLLDKVHAGNDVWQNFLWSVLHEPKHFVFGWLKIYVHYPLLPWIGIIALGYCFGPLYASYQNFKKRKTILLVSGSMAIICFILLRSFNVYGDAAQWHTQKNAAFSFLSFLNLTKYPPSLLYILATLGPALIILSLIEKTRNRATRVVTVFGRVPFFYYIAHIYLIHVAAMIAAIVSGFNWRTMILSGNVNAAQNLKGYGFNLFIVYLVWLVLVIILYPLCKWFDRYKRKHQSTKVWLGYL